MKRKAKKIVKEAWESVGMTWSITEEQNWRTCVRHGYFNTCQTVWDFMWMVGMSNERAKERYKGIPLFW